MYFVKYGNKYLHDPRVGLLLSSAKLDTENNKSDIFEFSIPVTHDVYNDIKEHDRENCVSVYSGEKIIFRGEVSSVKQDFHRTKTVSCRGELSYLNDSLVRPFSTVAGSSSRTAPSTIDGLFSFLINEHNSQVDDSKKFVIDKNLGSSLSEDNSISCEEASYPTVGELLKSKFITELGGNIQLTYLPDGTRTISLLKNFPDANEQVIDFGVNLLDFVKNVDASEIATFVIPTGSEESSGDGLRERLTIETYPDGKIDCADGVYTKQGDRLYFENAVAKYGWIGKVVEYRDETSVEKLVNNGILDLKSSKDPIMTIEIKAVDLSLIKSDYEAITVGQEIHVRSVPHDFDSFMLCSKISYDLLKPDNNTFTIGTVYKTLTGQSSASIKSLTSSINNVSTETKSEIIKIKADIDIDEDRIIESVKEWTNDELTKYATLEITEAGLNSKVGKGETVSEVNQSAEGLDISGNRLTVTSDNFELTADGTMRCTNAEIEGDVVANSFLSELDMRGYPIQIRMQAGTYPLVISSEHTQSFFSPNEYEVQGFGHAASISVYMNESLVEADNGIFDRINDIPVEEFGNGIKQNQHSNKSLITVNSSGDYTVQQTILTIYPTVKKDTDLTFTGMICPVLTGSSKKQICVYYELNHGTFKTQVMDLDPGNHAIPLFCLIPNVKRTTSNIFRIYIAGTFDTIRLIPGSVQGILSGVGLMNSSVTKSFGINSEYSDYVTTDDDGKLVANTEYSADGYSTHIDTGYLEKLEITTSDKSDIESVVITND